MRKLIFWSHLTVGLMVALVVLMLSLTGLLQTYEGQITRWAQTPIVSVTGAERLSADELAGIATIEAGGGATALRFTRDPDAAVAVQKGRNSTVFLDPFTGELLPEQAAGAAAFFSTVEHLHRWFALSGDGRDLGKAVTGAANLGFLFLLFSGAYLWWPRIWKWRIVRMNLWFRKGLPSSKARDYNWHHVFGFWAFVPLMAIVVSGVVISYPWASDLVFRLYGEEPVQLRRRAGTGQGASNAVAEVSGLDLALLQASAAIPDWRRMEVALPVAEKIRITVDSGTGRQPTKQVTLTMDARDGAVLDRSDFSDRSAGQQARIFLRFLHTGEIFGLLGQTLAGLAAAFALVMTYTGAALSYRRLIQPLLRRRRSRQTG